jgi:cytochrome c-type biogenesis protein CcmH/NrfG
MPCIVVLLSAALLPWETASAAAVRPTEAALNRDFERCRQSDLEACYDAIRWEPSNPALLVALGDALMHAARPADALRAYQRAEGLAPATPGLAKKIKAAEAKASAKRANSPAQSAANRAVSGKHFSNAAPEAQSH